jgi:formylglycine-generating enzyme required for sulfatase activity
VGTKATNELGIYDMSGNVRDWCNDWLGEYKSGAFTNPIGIPTGAYRVRRGGCWYYSGQYCRVSYRGSGAVNYSSDIVGFRLAHP